LLFGRFVFLLHTDDYILHLSNLLYFGSTSDIASGCNLKPRVIS